jgi:hypothetical protein
VVVGVVLGSWQVCVTFSALIGGSAVQTLVQFDLVSTV